MTLKIQSWSEHHRLFDCDLDGIDIKISQSSLVQQITRCNMFIVIPIHTNDETIKLVKELYEEAQLHIAARYQEEEY